MYLWPLLPPPDAVTVDRWLIPLETPTRLRALATAVVAASGMTWAAFAPAPPVEVVTVDKWHAPLREPVLAKPYHHEQAPAFAFLKAAPFPEREDLSKWGQPLSVPVRPKAQIHLPAVFHTPIEITALDKWYRPLEYHRPKLHAVQQQHLSPLQVDAPVEVVTLDKWYRLPDYLRLPQTVPWQQYLAFVKAAPFPEREDLSKWWVPLSEPTRIRGLAANAQQSLALVSAAPFGEASTWDRWAQPLALPVRIPSRLQTGSQQYLAFVKAAPFEAVTIDRWLQSLSGPILKPIITGNQQSLAFVRVEVADPGRWYAPFSAPVRPVRAWQVEQLQLLDVVADVRWWQPLSSPSQWYISVQQQQSIVFPRVDEITPADWMVSWSAPSFNPVRSQESLITTLTELSLEGPVTLDKWYQLLSQPSSEYWTRAASVVLHPSLFSLMRTLATAMRPRYISTVGAEQRRSRVNRDPGRIATVHGEGKTTKVREESRVTRVPDEGDNIKE